MRALVLLWLLACHGQRATAEDCGRILDRLVAIELHERGYRDPKLLEARRAEMRARFSDSLRGCVGRPIRADAMSCVEAARTTEELVHRCLR